MEIPEYLSKLVWIPEGITYRVLRWFHKPAQPLMVATASLEAELKKRGFSAPICRWSRGVDQNLFRPQLNKVAPYPQPILLYVGRVSAEKNIEAFLKLNTPGTKVVVGDGPGRAELEKAYPSAKFLGYKRGEELAACYGMADLFVFPSLTDTFGLVVIEALASGLPVAAFPSTGPVDIITDDKLGKCDWDLGYAVQCALKSGDRETCIAESQKYTWEHCTRQFLNNLVPVR
jgi:glycosyltransferase involved in cell wall biosynthesis